MFFINVDATLNELLPFYYAGIYFFMGMCNKEHAYTYGVRFRSFSRLPSNKTTVSRAFKIIHLVNRRIRITMYNRSLK